MLIGGKMTITRKMTADKLTEYLRHQITLTELTEWAEGAMMESEFEEEHLAEVREAVARLGLADVRAFGLAWEDCESILQKLGYAARVEVSAMESEGRPAAARPRP